MSSASQPPELTERLAGLLRSIEEGFAERAQALRAAADRLDAGDAEAREELRRLAHRLRGIAGSAGHPELSERAARLELAIDRATHLALAEGARSLAKAAERALAGAKKSEPPPPPPKREAPRLGWRVLAIDDEPATRRLLTLTFASAGCESTVLDDPEHAMTALGDRGPFDLVLLDAMMPRTTGVQLYEVLRKQAAELPIAILSASGPDELGWELPDDRRLTWLRKPFRPGRLLEELRAFVERAR